MQTAFQRLGGATVLRAIIDDFVDRVFDDAMIGFFFRNVARQRIKELEYQYAAVHLGGDVVYRGRPLRAAHASSPIMGGQFNRRKSILEQTLLRHGVPEDIRVSWLAHNESLRDDITGGRDCDITAARGKA